MMRGRTGTKHHGETRACAPARENSDRLARVMVVFVVAVAAAACSDRSDASKTADVGAAGPADEEAAAAEPASFTFLHVWEELGLEGNSSSAVLMGPDFMVIVDAGYPPTSGRPRAELVPIIESMGVDTIDLLVGTHPHSDHIGQMPAILEAFDVDTVWMAGSHPHDANNAHLHSQSYDAAAAAILQAAPEYAEPRVGEVHRFGSLELEILHPTSLLPVHERHVELNNDSLVIRATYGEVSLLLTGDVLAETEQRIVAQGSDVSATILELSHHGLADATTEEWLAAVSPEIAIASGGAGSAPADTVVDRVTTSGASLYVTGAHGHVTVHTDGRTIDMSTSTDAPPIRSLETWYGVGRLLGVRDDVETSLPLDERPSEHAGQHRR